MSRKIVIGICGIGLGHSKRQKVVVDYLLHKEHQLVILAFGESYRLFKDWYPNVPIFEVWVPWIYGTNTGLDLIRTAADENNQNNSYIAQSFLAMEKVRAAFHGRPDVVLTDYEPVSAQMSYVFGVPLICLEQQSKYLGYQTEDINGFSREQEAARLRLFFPHAVARIASSFFPITSQPDREYNVEIVPPILREQVATMDRLGGKSEDVLVYFSPYGPAPQPIEEVLKLLAKFSGMRFTVYTASNAVESVPQKIDAITFKQYHEREFLHVLSTSRAVISTAGHQLISEAVYLGKPVFVLPFSTYEQQYNAHMVSHFQIGSTAACISYEALGMFLENAGSYARNTLEVLHIMQGYTGRSIMISRLAEYGL